MPSRHCRVGSLLLLMITTTWGEDVSHSCSNKKDCTDCLNIDECTWCGSCKLSSDCNTGGDMISSDCNAPGVKFLENLAWLVGTAVMLGYILFWCNSYQTRKMKMELEQSIFKLPCYVYGPSSQQEAGAAGSPSAFDLETEGSPKSSDLRTGALASETARKGGGTGMDALAQETKDDKDPGMMTPQRCSICLSQYEDSQLIKVLPCKHEFHQECLDTWLNVRTTCPLCMEHVFGKHKSKT